MGRQWPAARPVERAEELHGLHGGTHPQDSPRPQHGPGRRVETGDAWLDAAAQWCRGWPRPRGFNSVPAGRGKEERGVLTMPWDGSGNFTRVMNWINDATAGIKIKSD